MSVPKKASVVSVKKIQDDVVSVTCRMADPEQLGFTGGQYIIVNSGIVMPNGKLGKRAYSIVSADTDQATFEIIVKRIGAGVGSNFIHNLKPGDVFEFSGPWGKIKPAEGTQDRNILCLATDTGITMVLGLLNGKTYSACLSRAEVIWMIDNDPYFIPADHVKKRLPANGHSRIVTGLPAAGTEARLSFCMDFVESYARERFDKIYLSGDGDVIKAWEAWFLDRGYTEGQILKESFFHHESMKAPSAQTTNAR